MTTIANISPESRATLTLGEWADVVCRTYVSVHCERREGGPFEAWIHARRFGVAMISEVGSTPMHYVRGASEVRFAPSEDVQVLLVRDGRAVVKQDERACGSARATWPSTTRRGLSSSSFPSATTPSR